MFFYGYINIICNSMVKNKSLLKHINPQLLVFADPVFHMSHNEYAEEFRQNLSRGILIAVN